MKRKFTLLIAALALLTMIVQPGRAWGQTKGEITWTASAQGYTNQQEITSVTFDSSVSGSFNKGTNSNPPKYFTSGTAIRCYGGNYFTISSSNTLTAITISFGNSDGSNAITTDVGTYSNGSWTGSANSVTFTIGGSSGNRRIAGFNITYSSGGTPTIATPTITPNGGNFITSQEVSISCTTEDVTIYYTLDGNDPTTTSTQYANPFTITETTTVKAFAVKDGYNDSNIATAEFTKATAMTIAEVRAQQTGDVFTTGIVTSCVGTTGYIQDATAAICVYGASLTVGNEISVSGSLQDYNGLLEITSPQVTVVSSGNVVDPEVMTVAEAVASTNQGWYIRIENATVTAISGSNTTIAQGESTIVVRGISGVTLAVNDVVSLNGNIGCYNSNQIANPQNVTVQQPTEPTITLSSYAINVAADGENGSIEVTFENFTNLEPEIQFFEADGVTPASYNWMTAALDAENEHVTYQIAANDSDARTAYFKVYEASEGVYSNLVTVGQAAYVAPSYAALPFAFNGGRADIENTDGLSQEGLGTDYNASSNPTTKLKFDGTGDWVLLQFNERPGTLTFDIKGNSFSGGTFTIQTSVDGVTYTALQAYTELGDTQSVEFGNLAEDVRYIKWIYTNKASGNVGLGNIALAQYVEPQPSITITPAAITEVPCYGGGGLLEVTYANMGDTPNPQIIKCDSDGNPATYDWLTAEFENGTANIRGTISANNSNADRTAYLKVCGTAVNSETVCSNIVSITQLAYPTITTATLPFAFDGDNEELATTAGLAQAGLGSSYGDSPKLKFKETGSFVILHFNEAPNTLTFDIKGDGFDGTFKVQTSADNVTYTDLKEYTSSNLTDNLVSESFNTLNANVRYIKWVYTAATSGKVRLGNIGLTNFSPSITLNTYAISVDANQHDGTLDATYEFIDFTNDPEVVWFESDGVTPAANDPDWVVAIINTDKDFDYTIDENNDAASRTAYFKVYALAETSGNGVYSDLVTVTQEGKVTLYTIMFDTDGGTFVGNNDFNSEIVQKQTGVYSLPSATKDNVTFAGWKLDGTDDIYAAGASYEVTTDVSFTAQWTNALTGTISFGSGQGSTNINNTSITGDDSAGNTWTITTEGTTSFTPNAGYAQIGSSSKPATSITFTTTLSNDVTITAFSAKFGGFSGTAGNITLKVGETTVGTGSLSATADVTVNNTSTAYGNLLTVTVTNIAKGVKAYYISYSYEMGTDPIIIASTTSVDLAYNATSGEIGYSIVNPTTATLTAVPSDTWIAIDNIDNTKVTFTTTENTEYIPRQGTITLSYEGADDVEVTVNQAAAPMPAENFALFTGDLVEGDYIIYYDGKAMKNTVTSGRLDYVDDVTPNNNIIATDNAAIIWHIAPSDEYWTIYSADADAFAASTGANNKADLYQGTPDEYDKALWTVSGTEVYEFVNKFNSENDKNANLRNNGIYGFACYSNSTGGALTLYKKTTNIVTYNTTITGYGNSEDGGYYLIASPVSANPTDGTNMIAETEDNYDLYRFDQTADAEWYNYKAHHFYLTPGKGYLYASKETIDLTFKGMPYEGDGKINLTYDDGATLAGWNLIGNPYGTSATLSQAYYRLNAEGNALNAETESSAVNLMEGVFVKATAEGQTATFTAQGKNETKAIAQTNIMVSNAKGSVIDNAIVRFDGGSTLEKFSLRDGSTQLYIPQNDNNYAIVSADAEGDMPLNFKAETTGQYTIRIKIDGASVGYMHLIDKLAGKDINLLINPEYSFIGSPRDAEDRFIIRFTEIDANNIFAYQSGSDIIVNGNGELQVFDVTGRMVMNTKINGIQTVNVPATGMYIFRMVGESVQTQKIVVR